MGTDLIFPRQVIIVGPLHGIKIIEIVGMGPAPYAAMLLADLGADVIRVDRPGGSPFSYGNKLDLLNRNKQCVCVNLKSPEGITVVKKLLETADGLIEGFRPGTMEKLGLAPDVCFSLNPKLVYGRVTGWGQDGPLALKPGHDLNYVSLSAVTHALGRAGEKPTVPLPLIGDFSGGGLFAALGMVSALLEASRSGKGQVVDASIVDGTAHLMSSIYAAQQIGFWSHERGENLLDGGAPFYEVYTCCDGKYLSVAAIEPQFYAEFLRGLGYDSDEINAFVAQQMNQAHWIATKEKFSAILRTKTRNEWVTIFAVLETCVAPVLSSGEAHVHPHNVARETFIENDGVWQPRPAPRFSRCENSTVRPPVPIGADTDQLLQGMGYTTAQIDALKQARVIA
jgi:alpha-methylacyl-CoA racemase